MVLSRSPARRRQPDNSSETQPDVPGLASRKAAAKLLAAVVDAKTPLDGMVDAEHGHPQYAALSGPDRSLVRAILLSALRFRGTITQLIAARLRDALPPRARALEHILHVGAAQILFLDVPDSAAVDLAVTHAKSDPRTARFGGLVNGLLRSLSREKETDLPPALDRAEDAPHWFRSKLETAYGEEKARAILQAHRVEAPVDFTVRADPAQWAERLGGTVLPNGSVRVARLPAPVPDLPGFSEGAWWVQDAAASLPARLLGGVSGLRVADLCAAPGGKTAQLALAGAEVTAFDISRSRLKRLRHNLERLGLEAETVEADILRHEPAELFDAILLDAPCSSTGTVRRHPDVPWTKGPEDVAKLAALQRRLIERAVQFVKPGGRVVFSNCSLMPEEGEDLWAAFLREVPGIEPEPFRADEIEGIAPFVSQAGTLRTTPADWPSSDPSVSGLDGFFAARFRVVK